MQAFNERLQIVLNYNGLSQRKFAQTLGIHAKSAQNYLGGKTSPDGEVMEKICRTFEVSANWLLLGHGNMTMSEEDRWSGNPREIQYVLRAYRGLRPKRRKVLRGFLTILRRLQRHDGLNTWVQKVVDSDEYQDLWAVRERFDRKEWGIIKAFADYKTAHTILRYRQEGKNAGGEGEAEARENAQALNKELKKAFEEFVKDWEQFLEGR